MDDLHYPVLYREVLELLVTDPAPKLLIDATLGGGGHTRLFLEKYSELKAIGIDADPDVLAIAKRCLAEYSDTGRLQVVRQWFDEFFGEYPPGDEQPDVMLFDLGISMHHYKSTDRGFSFDSDDTVDMRIDPELPVSANDILKKWPESQLADAIFGYGGERLSRRIARAICRQRNDVSCFSARRVSEIVCRAMPAGKKWTKTHPATRTFQALRIVVNNELARLELVLKSAFSVLKPGGRIGVISFHSLEDRIVKQIFQNFGRRCVCAPDQPICSCEGVRQARILTKKPIFPGEEELAENPASRSARLRVIQKL